MKAAFLSVKGVRGLVCAVGSDGRILHFGGDLYRPIEPTSPTGHDLHSVWLADRRNGWAVGDAGTILHWDGDAWRTIALASRNRRLDTVWGASPSDIWIGGDRALYHVQPDGGESIATGAHVLAIWGSGRADVWFLCAGRIAMHWDGKSLAFVRLPGSIGEEYRAIGGSGRADVWALGLCGLAAHFDGRRWAEVEHGSAEHFTGICCAEPGEVWATAQSGHLLRWGGDLWETRAVNALGSLNGLCALPDAIWACGAGRVVMTHRPGKGDE